MFSGTWNASGDRSVIFAGNTFNYKVDNEPVYSGTFSVSGSTINFNTSNGPASCNFTLSAETLVISNHPDPRVNGTYTKGSGGSGNTMACKYIYENSFEFCHEISERLKPGSNEIILAISEVEQEYKESCEGELRGIFYDSCPSGYVLKCFIGDNDYNHTGYFYGDEFRDLSCEEVDDKM